MEESKVESYAKGKQLPKLYHLVSCAGCLTNIGLRAAFPPPASSTTTGKHAQLWWVYKHSVYERKERRIKIALKSLKGEEILGF